MARSDWTDEQLRDAMLHGVCRFCGEPRKAQQELAPLNLNTAPSEIKPPSWKLICPNGHEQ